MLGHFGWRAAVAILVSTSVYFVCSSAATCAALAERRRCRSFDARRAARRRIADRCQSRHGSRPSTSPSWHGPSSPPTIRCCSSAAFSFFLGFTQRDRGVPEPHRSPRAAPRRLLSRRPGRFTAGCRAGGSRPSSRSLTETPLFFGATVLTAFNDNALITYLATLVPDSSRSRSPSSQAPSRGGLTVIANAPNPPGRRSAAF